MQGIGAWFGAAVLSILCVLPGSAQAKRVALIIGNSAYQHAPTLPNPMNDATDVAAALRALNIDVIEGMDLGKSEMDRKIRDFSIALTDADAGIFYFAGHGLQVGGTNYLVPIDAELSTVAALEFEMVRLDLVQRIMEGQANTNIVFLDACRNNPMARNLARAMGTRSANIGRGLAAVESGVGTLISFSTQPGNVALDGEGRNSPYAAALVKHIAVPGASLTDLLVDVRSDVMTLTQRKQVPWEHSALTGRFYFSSTPKAIAPPPATIAAPLTTLSPAAEAWDRAKDSKNPVILEAFTKRFGETIYADMARAQLDELRKRQQATAPQPRVPETNVAVLANPAVDKADVCNGVKVLVGANNTPLCIKPGSGIAFRDCWEVNNDAACGPEMVVVPAGSFVMGSPATEPNRLVEEAQHTVSIPEPFAIGRVELTFDEWDACHAAGGCSTNPKDLWGRGRQPVMRISWMDAQQYVRWLSGKTKRTYRLPTQAEWEYAARANSQTAFTNGETLSPSDANVGTRTTDRAFRREGTLPVGSFKPNAFGLYDVHGNVWEWNADCYGKSSFTPTKQICAEYVLRGGSWASELHTARLAANQARGATTLLGRDLGVRVIRVLGD